MKRILFLSAFIIILFSVNTYCEDVYREEYNSKEWAEINKNVPTKTIFTEEKNDIFYIKISKFEKGTLGELINVLNKNKYENIIIDLRNNSGGYIDVAIESAALFIDNNKETVSVLYDDGTKKSFCGTGEFSGTRPVILINTLTASAAEAFALSLTQNGIASVGEETYGKSSIQRYSANKNGGEKNTVGHFVFGSLNIQNKGIKPKYIVHNTINMVYDVQKKTYTVTETDDQLEYAVGLLKEGK